MSVILTYPQTNTKSLIKKSGPVTTSDEPKKVFIHFMGWYGSGEAGFHWNEGHIDTPLIGSYPSHSWATLTYQMLLSWSCGIDGLVINVKDDTDAVTLNMLVPTINMLHKIDSVNFKYNFSISYDDQGMADISNAITKFKFLKNNILPGTPCFLRYHDTAVIFIWNYKPPSPEYLTALDYKTALDSVFPENRPKVLWNEIEAPEIANSYYPWVQGWANDGSNWGKTYLDWYYPAINGTPGLDFATGGVWAGFNDSVCSWGHHYPLLHWIDRKNGTIYDSTWQYIHTYSGTTLPLKWVYIETWNDWNEGTEIEPSIEYRYQYLDSTIKNINSFKDTSISMDTCIFYSAGKLYEASKAIELKQRDSVLYFPILRFAIKNFLTRNCDATIAGADSVINGLRRNNWDDTTLWTTSFDNAATINFLSYPGKFNDGLKIDFSLPQSNSWVNISKHITFPTDSNCVTFLLKTTPSNQHGFLELKFIDKDGTIFWTTTNLGNFKDYWYRIVVYLENTTWTGWGGQNSSFDTLSKFDIAISTDSASSGTVLIDEIGSGHKPLESSFYYEGKILDPDSLLAGNGFKQRRDNSMVQEDALVYEYLKAIQDQSPNDSTLGSYNGDDSYETFDNSLAAMAFILEKDSIRSGKILDFYAAKTDTNNTNVNLQNFYYRKTLSDSLQPRGFYQRAYFNSNLALPNNDRWIGDMAWLYMAYNHYLETFSCEKKYSYKNMLELISSLIKSYYKQVSNDTGYIQSGWRKGDTQLHEKNGHHEGNIDCYAVLKTCNDLNHAAKIRNWIEGQLDSHSGFPLDLYGWRVLAYEKGSELLLNIPEFDFRYRKILRIHNDSVVGFFTGGSEFRNIWPDGTAHMASAFLNYGDVKRGNFYANQLDKLIIQDTINGTVTHSIPYIIKKIGGYGGVDTSMGSVSAAAWYIIAKHSFNPLKGTNIVVQCIDNIQQKETDLNWLLLFPNPATKELMIKTNQFSDFLKFEILNTMGQIISRGTFKYSTAVDVSDFTKGIYFIRVYSKSNAETLKFLVE